MCIIIFHISWHVCVHIDIKSANNSLQCGNTFCHIETTCQFCLLLLQSCDSQNSPEQSRYLVLGRSITVLRIRSTRNNKWSSGREFSSSWRRENAQSGVVYPFFLFCTKNSFVLKADGCRACRAVLKLQKYIEQKQNHKPSWGASGLEGDLDTSCSKSSEKKRNKQLTGITRIELYKQRVLD